MSKYELNPIKEGGHKCMECGKPATLEIYEGAGYYNVFCDEECYEEYEKG